VAPNHIQNILFLSSLPFLNNSTYKSELVQKDLQNGIRFGNHSKQRWLKH
jgi:hypothetical protein